MCYDMNATIDGEAVLLNLEKTRSELTMEEKAAIVSGTDFMYTNAIPRLGIPALCMADGPHGLRKMTNGHLLRGIKCICTPVKVLVLPKEKKKQTFDLRGH